MWITRIIAFYLLWLFLAGFLQRYVLFPRHVAQENERAAEGVAGLERLSIQTDQGVVEGWFIPGDGVSADKPGPVVIFAHGNAELIDDFVPIAVRYRELGVSVLLAEFRGYGRSAGSPSQRKLTDDYVRFYDLVAARPDVDAKRIVYHGRSVGGGVSCALATKRKPAAIILQSPFTSVKRMAGRFLVPPLFVWDPFDNVSALRGYDGPVLVMHGVRDTIIPISHGRELARVAPRGRIVEFPCGHNDFPMHSEEFWEEVERFLRESGVIGG